MGCDRPRINSRLVLVGRYRMGLSTVIELGCLPCTILTPVLVRFHSCLLISTAVSFHYCLFPLSLSPAVFFPLSLSTAVSFHCSLSTAVSFHCCLFPLLSLSTVFFHRFFPLSLSTALFPPLFFPLLSLSTAVSFHCLFPPLSFFHCLPLYLSTAVTKVSLVCESCFRTMTDFLGYLHEGF